MTSEPLKQPLVFFNTAKRALEEFRSQDGKTVKMYTCGPTVYHFAHIGNFRTYVFEDILRRTLKFFGYKITQVMNITDVDDKTIRGAIQKDCPLIEYTTPYTEAFFEDLKTLHIEPAEFYPKATDYIPQMIEMIQSLIEKKVAYVGHDGSIYYSIAHFPSYGCLSHLHLDELKVGASDRVASDEYDKESAADFVLWKAYDPERDGKIYWDSPFGKGRPGWHLECSCMAISLLGNTLDIHVGAVDNIFPHHENEIAQSEAFSGKKFVNLWMHSEHLIVDGKKMSKSLGNFYTLRDLLNKGFTGRQVRYLLLSSHYKTQLNFTMAGVEGAKATLQRLDDFVARMQGIQEGKTTSALDEILNRFFDEFCKGLAADLNTAQSLAHLFEMIREVNVLADKKEVGKEGAEKVLAILKRIDSVLGVIDFELETAIPKELQQLLEERILARKNKDWKEADRLRDEISAKGYVIEDSSSGARLKKL